MKKLIVFALAVLIVVIGLGIVSKTKAQVPSGFLIGDRVATAFNGVVVRNSPTIFDSSGRSFGDNKKGFIIDGPKQSSSGPVYTWWKVDFDSINDGWIREGDIKLIQHVDTSLITPLAGQLPSSKFSINNRVQVSIAPGARLKVLEDPRLDAVLGSHPNRAIGTVLAGPSYRGGDWYWKIDIDDGADGWMSEAGLVKLQPKFEKGDKVKTLVSLYVRTTPGGSLLGSLPLRSGVEGTVVEGPTYYRDYVWWKVNWGRVYCTGVIPIYSCADSVGWSAEADIPGTTNYLEKLAFAGNSLTGLSISSQDIVSAGKEYSYGIVAQGGGTLTYIVNWGDGSNNRYTALAGQVVSARHIYSIGNYTISVTVRDSNGKSLTSTATVQAIKDTSSGLIDTFSFIAPGGGEQWQVGQRYNITFDNSDMPGVKSAQLQLVDKISGLSVSTIADLSSIQLLSGVYSWMIPNTVTPGSYWIKAKVLRANNSTVSATSGSFTIVGGGTPGNNSPTISGVSGPTSLNSGQSGTWVVSASDLNGDVLSYSVVWEDGATGAAQSGSSFTHTYSTAGTYTARFTVNDGRGGSASRDAVVVVGGGDNATSTPSGSISVGERVKLIGSDTVVIEKAPNVNNPFNIEGTQFVDSSPSWSGLGFSDFKTGKGTIIEGPSGSGSDTKWRVDYDYGPDGWTLGSKLQSIGIPTGKWGFMSGNILGRELNTGDGSLVIDPYYVSVNYQVSIPSNMAQSSLPPAGVTAQAGLGGSWNCQGTYTGSMATNNFLGDSVCRYVKGNMAPQVNLTGAATAFTDVGGTWQFTASDPEGALSSYKIDWGDGIVSDSTPLSGASVTKDVQHTYVQTGTYTIKLTITDSGGLTATASLAVTVTAPCSTRFQKGDGVRVINSNAEHALSVRSSPERPSDPNLNRLGGHYDNDQGTVSGGPVSGSGYCWWQVNFDQTPSGWAAEGGGNPIQYWLEKISGGPGPGDEGIESIAITSPATGNIWNIGDSRVIRWTTPAGVTKVHIYLAGVGPIAFNELNTGSYTWTIPAILNGRELNGSNFAISIYAADEGVMMSQTSPRFSIIPGAIQEDGATNQLPVLGVPTGQSSIIVNTLGTWQITATDSDSTSLVYTVLWGDGGTDTYSGTSGQSVPISHTYTSTGSKTIQVTVSDGQLSDSESITIDVTSTGGGTIGRPARLSIGDNVKTIVSNLQVRSIPPAVLNASSLGRLSLGTLGTVLEGPVSSAGYWWWRIRWNASWSAVLEGWSAEVTSDGKTFYIEKIVGGGTTNPATTTQTSKNTLTIRVGAYAPLFNNPQLPPLGNPQGLKTFEFNGRVWTWVGSSGLWRLTSGPDLTITYQ